MDKKTYLGNCKSQFDGDIIKWAIPLSKINELIEKGELKSYNFKDEDYLNVKIHKKKEEHEWGKTHYVVYDSFDPKQQPKEMAAAKPSSDDDLPF